MGDDKGPGIWATRFCILLRNLTLLVVLALLVVIEIGVVGYLREQPSWYLAALLGGAAMLLAGAAAFSIPKFVKRKVFAAILQLALLALLVVPPLSAWKGGGIRHARDGLTVVGLCPIPVFDLQFDADGRVWFRNKSHTVTAAEVRALAGDGVDLVIIGTGWQGRATTEPTDVGIQVETLRNDEALANYHRLRAEGKRVALILHTTC